MACIRCGLGEPVAAVDEERVCMSCRAPRRRHVPRPPPARWTCRSRTSGTVPSFERCGPVWWLSPSAAVSRGATKKSIWGRRCRSSCTRKTTVVGRRARAPRQRRQQRRVLRLIPFRGELIGAPRNQTASSRAMGSDGSSHVRTVASGSSLSFVEETLPSFVYRCSITIFCF